MEPFGEWAADAEAPSGDSSGEGLFGAGGWGAGAEDASDTSGPGGPAEEAVVMPAELALAAVPAGPDEAHAQQELVALPPGQARRDLRAFAERGQHLGGACLQHTDNV